MIRARLNGDETGYSDLTLDPNTTNMAQLACLSVDTPPTHVTWFRNGEEIENDGLMYYSVQIVTDRFNSHYKTVLVVKQVINIIGELHFSCVLSNFGGNTSFAIPTNISGTVYTYGFGVKFSLFSLLGIDMLSPSLYTLQWFQLWRSFQSWRPTMRVNQWFCIVWELLNHQRLLHNWWTVNTYTLNGMGQMSSSWIRDQITSSESQYTLQMVSNVV